MDYWVSKGAPKEKLNVGLATYGRSFTLTSAANSKPGAPSSGPSPAGKYTGEAGFLAYYEVKKLLISIFEHISSMLILMYH